jgi:hypothetical protein
MSILMHRAEAVVTYSQVRSFKLWNDRLDPFDLMNEAIDRMEDKGLKLELDFEVLYEGAAWSPCGIRCLTPWAAAILESGLVLSLCNLREIR